MSEPASSEHLDELALLDLADGVPSPELRARAEAHLDGCAACREQLAGFLRARAVSVPAAQEAPTQAVSTLGMAPRVSSAGIPVLARGTLLGRYVVLEHIGAGGMGVVYSAYDPSLDRRIGLKLLRALPGEGGTAERLMREAQAAARTRHPHVVAVHDVGALGDLVFIAMELVEGGTLRRHLADVKPPWREVVRLYVQAGRGLSAAHAAGVVHCDFKPDNVLVDRDGRARVTDFGLAHLVSSAESVPPLPAGLASPRTGEGSAAPSSVAGTPGYIAPEVLAGQPADARSDQYSFCVALYEGLHGKRPPPPGERALAPRGNVPRGVHAVIARGLSREPGARHASMAALLDSLERAAFPRVRRWTAVAVGTGLLAVTVAVVGLRGPRPCAEDAARLAGTWDGARAAALLKAFEATGAPSAASAHAAMRRALDAYATSWTEARRDACEATRVRGEQSEAVMDLRMRCLERRRRELSALADVLLTVDAAGVPRAPEAAQALSPLATCADVEALSQPVPPPDRPEVAARVDAAYAALADASARLAAGRWVEVVERASATAAEAEALGYKPLLGEALLLEGRAHQQLRDEKKALLALRRAALASQAGRDDLHAIEALVYLVFVEGAISERPEQAAQWAEQARALLERVGGEPRLESALLHNEGTALVRQGHLLEAIPLLEKALSSRERIYGVDHPKVGDVLVSLGLALKGQGRLADALAYHQRAHRIFETALGPDHPYTAVALINEGTTLALLGRNDEALERMEQSLVRMERAHGPGKAVGYMLNVLGNMGALYTQMGRVAEARSAFERALTLAREQFPPGHPDRVRQAGNLAQALIDDGQPAAALALFESLEVELAAAAAEGRSGSIFAMVHSQAAEVLLRTGHVERAVQKARQGVAALRTLGASDELVWAHGLLSQALVKSGHALEAQRAAEEGLAVDRALPGSEHASLPEVQTALGEALLARGDATGARAPLEQALADWEKEGALALDMARVRFALARALRLGHVEPERARALATAAREAVAPTKEPRRVPLADLDAFLRER